MIKFVQDLGSIFKENIKPVTSWFVSGTMVFVHAKIEFVHLILQVLIDLLTITSLIAAIILTVYKIFERKKLNGTNNGIQKEN